MFFMLLVRANIIKGSRWFGRAAAGRNGKRRCPSAHQRRAHASRRHRRSVPGQNDLCLKCQVLMAEIWTFSKIHLVSATIRSILGQFDEPLTYWTATKKDRSQLPDSINRSILQTQYKGIHNVLNVKNNRACPYRRPDVLTSLKVSSGGAWGTALAAHCARMGHSTLLWAREPEVVADINDPDVRENRMFLKARSWRHDSDLQCAVCIVDLKST